MIEMTAMAIVFMAGMATGPNPSAAGGVQETRQIVLDEKSAGKVHRIRTGRGAVTTLEFPEDVEEAPKCGDCVGQTNEDGLFHLEWNKQGRYLTVWPNHAAARRSSSVDNATTILVRMEHATLTLFVEWVERRKSDSRVVFVYPERKAESEYLRVEKAKLEAEAEARIADEAGKRFVEAFREPHHCETKSARSRNDFIVLEVTEICYFGRQVVIVFTVENRGKAPMAIGAVELNKGQRKQGELSQTTLEFQQVSTGVEVVTLGDREDSRGPYELTVYESSGKHRAVKVGGVEL
ncbi:MAG TPA: hypothetical protein VMK12_19685 [Anaeromyxobacteraceae bacterium]|nr:hypothetical protein [Anaeromyxobacteraceae bacterium]